MTWEGECKDARCEKLQKEMCVNSFGNVFVSLVQKAANAFFKKFTLMTLIVTHLIRPRKDSRNKINEAWVA